MGKGYETVCCDGVPDFTQLASRLYRILLRPQPIGKLEPTPTFHQPVWVIFNLVTTLQRFVVHLSSLQRWYTQSCFSWPLFMCAGVEPESVSIGYAKDQGNALCLANRTSLRVLTARIVRPYSRLCLQGGVCLHRLCFSKFIFALFKPVLYGYIRNTCQKLPSSKQVN